MFTIGIICDAKFSSVIDQIYFSISYMEILFDDFSEATLGNSSFRVLHILEIHGSHHGIFATEI